MRSGLTGLLPSTYVWELLKLLSTTCQGKGTVSAAAAIDLGIHKPTNACWSLLPRLLNKPFAAAVYRAN